PIECVTVVADDASIRNAMEIDIRAVALRRIEGVVQCSDRIRWRDDLQREVGECLHLPIGERCCSPLEALKSNVEGLESGHLVHRIPAVRIIAAGAIAPPVHWAMSRNPSKSLCGQGALHGMEVNSRRIRRDERIGIGYDHAIRIPEVPREMTHIPKNTTSPKKTY